MRKRYAVVALLAVVSVITFIDRTAIAVLAPWIRRDLGMGAAEWGWVLSAYVIAYGIFEIPSGARGQGAVWAASRLGGALAPLLLVPLGRPGWQGLRALACAGARRFAACPCWPQALRNAAGTRYRHHAAQERPPDRAPRRQPRARASISSRLAHSRVGPAAMPAPAPPHRWVAPRASLPIRSLRARRRRTASLVSETRYRHRAAAGIARV